MQQEVMQQCKEACLDEQDAPGKIQTQRKNTEKVAATLGNLGGIQKHCLVQLGQMKLRCPPTSTNLWSQKHIGLPIFFVCSSVRWGLSHSPYCRSLRIHEFFMSAFYHDDYTLLTESCMFFPKGLFLGLLVFFFVWFFVYLFPSPHPPTSSLLIHTCINSH